MHGIVLSGALIQYVCVYILSFSRSKLQHVFVWRTNLHTQGSLQCVRSLRAASARGTETDLFNSPQTGRQ